MSNDQKLARLFSLSMICRVEQKFYFKNRNQANLIAAKEAEKNLDEFLKEVQREYEFEIYTKEIPA